MNLNNIPNNKRDAEIHLKGMKQAILELFGELQSDCLPVECSVTGAMHKAIDEINELLGD